MNYALESLLKAIEQSREDEQKRYFDSLVQNAVEIESSQIINGQEYQKSIESIFSLNLKNSLLTFQQYQQKILNERDELMDKTKKKFGLNRD